MNTRHTDSLNVHDRNESQGRPSDLKTGSGVGLGLNTRGVVGPDLVTGCEVGPEKSIFLGYFISKSKGSI